MKKLWVLLLCALLAALCFDALAEEDLIGEASEIAPDEAVEVRPEDVEASEDAAVENQAEEEIIVAAEAMDEIVPESDYEEELPLDEDFTDELYAEAEDVFYSDEAADAQLYEGGSASDFEITNGVLMKYNGPGGDVVIPSEVTVIGSAVFSNRTDISNITIPFGVKSIGASAFSGCTGLSIVSIPNSVTSMGGHLFRNCVNLTNVTLSNGISSISDYAFCDCRNLASIDIPDTVTKIGMHAFNGCSSLTSVIIPSKVTSVGWGLFNNCVNLKNVVIPYGVNDLNSQTFNNCTSLTSVIIPGSVNGTNYRTFGGCTSLTDVIISEGFDNLEWATFEDCTGLTSITIPGSVRRIGEDAFHKCYNLTSVTIKAPSDFKNQIMIDDQAFSDCPSTIIFYTPCETAATKWAESKGYTVVKSDHIVETLPARAATTTKNGLTEGKRCSACGKIIEAQQTIPMLTNPIVPTQPIAPGIPEVHLTKKGSNTINVGDVFKMVVDGKTVKFYKSSKPGVASVARDGTVTAKKAGKAKITATYKQGKKTKKAVLTVKVVDPYAPKRVSIAQGGSVTLHVGETLQLTPALTPGTAKTTYKWKSSKKGVARVDSSGLVTARKKGTAKITVTTGNKKKATIRIKVVK